jgi:hypothetical protein
MMDEEISTHFAQIARSSIFIRDATEVSRISDDDFSKLISALEDAGHCHSRLADYLDDKTQNKSGLQALINFLKNLSRLRAAYKLSSDLSERLLKPIIESAFTEKNPSNCEAEIFLRRLPTLLVDYDLVRREIKINDLDDMTAAYLEEFAILCDLRPLFSEEGNSVEYLFPHATLHIQFDVAGQSQSHDIRISEKQITEIMDKALRARKKIKALTAYTREINLANTTS